MKEIKTKIIDLLKKHWQIIVLAFIVGLLVVLPTLVSIGKIGANNFKGVYPAFNKDEIHYLAKAREAVDGHPSLGNVFYYEHKGDPFMQPPLIEIITAGITNIFNISVPALFVINDFILPFTGVIMLYILFLNITSSKKISLISSLVFYLLFLFTFGRPINPQFSFIFLISGLILIWHIIKDNQNLKNKIILNLSLGAITGFLVYVYPYFWTTLFVTFVLAIIINLNRQNFVFYLKKFLFFFLTFFIFALPYLINQKNILSNPFYEETALRMGMLNNHWPSCYVNVGLVIITLAIIFIGWKKYEDKKIRNLSIALLLSAIILNWQNIITGKYLQFSSHYLIVSIFFVYIVLVVLINNIVNIIKRGDKFFKFKDWLINVGILALISIIIFRQFPDFKNGINIAFTGTEIKYLQEMERLFSWLNSNTEKDSVVYSLCENCSTFIPIYTGNYLYFNGYGGYYIMSDDEVEDRWARQNIFIDNIDKDFIKNNDRAIWLNKFIDKYQNESIRRKIIAKLTGRQYIEPERISDIYPARVYEKYKEIKKENPETALKKYRVGYLVLDTADDKYKGVEEKLKKYGFLEPLEKIDNYIIYRVN